MSEVFSIPKSLSLKIYFEMEFTLSEWPAVEQKRGAKFQTGPGDIPLQVR
jgi:hypothetical protein